MKSKLIAALIMIMPLAVFAQSADENNNQDEVKTHWTSASELIFSWGIVEDDPNDISAIIRFTGFFHFQEQLHFDFDQHIGLMTGFGVRNVGMINDINDSVKLKQRSYSFGIPIGLKLGNLEKNQYVVLGAEAELMFHYKQKAFYDDSKFKKSEWFSDRTNLINPSVFLDMNFKSGAYIRFKYYLLDFLRGENQSVSVDGTAIPYSPEKSQLFYFGFGMNLDKSKLERQSQKTKDTYSSL